MQESEIVKQIRQKSGLTQSELSRRLDFKPTPGQISGWENGDRGITFKSFYRLCKAADVVPSEILKACGL